MNLSNLCFEIGREDLDGPIKLEIAPMRSWSSDSADEILVQRFVVERVADMRRQLADLPWWAWNRRSELRGSIARLPVWAELMPVSCAFLARQYYADERR